MKPGLIDLTALVYLSLSRNKLVYNINMN